MNDFKKNLININRFFAVCLIVIITIPLSAASVTVAESLLSQGKYETAITKLEPLADQDDPKALFLLSHIYLTPEFKFLNIPKGLALLRKAVFHNYGPAIDTLAGLYLSGDGVEKSEARALNYYIQGSFLGYGPSQFNCGIMYKEGQGTNKDPAKAYLHLCLASLNKKDLDDVTIDAARYRDELVPLLTPTQRQDVLRQVNLLTLPINYDERERQ